MQDEQESAGDDEVVAADAPASSEHHDTRHLSSRRRRRLRRRRLPSNKPATSQHRESTSHANHRPVVCPTWPIDVGRLARRRQPTTPTSASRGAPTNALTMTVALARFVAPPRLVHPWPASDVVSTLTTTPSSPRPLSPTTNRWATRRRIASLARDNPRALSLLSLFIPITMSLATRDRRKVGCPADAPAEGRVSSTNMARNRSWDTLISFRCNFTRERESGDSYPPNGKVALWGIFFSQINIARYNCVLNSIAFFHDDLYNSR